MTVPSQLSLGELESELVGLAGHIAAAQCRFLQLLAEFDSRDGWAGRAYGPARTGCPGEPG